MNLWNKYAECPLCGMLHDDGAFYSLHDKTYFICLDCSESMTKDEILQAVKENEKLHSADKRSMVQFNILQIK